MNRRVKTIYGFVYCNGKELEGMTVFQDDDGLYTIYESKIHRVRQIPNSEDVYEVIAA